MAARDLLAAHLKTFYSSNIQLHYSLNYIINKYLRRYVDEATKKDCMDTLKTYDKLLIVSDPRRCEPKKFGGPGARSRFQKSYR